MSSLPEHLASIESHEQKEFTEGIKKLGFKGDEELGDIVRAAMFSRNFPEVKSPEEMAFEGKIEGIISGEEIDLDELSAAEFLTEDEDEQDDENMLEILEDLDFLATEPTKKRKMQQQQEGEGTKKSKTEEVKGLFDKDEEADKRSTCPNTDKDENKEKRKEDKKERQKIVKEIKEMDEMERKAIGAFFMSLKEMRKAAKINLRALTRLQELVKRYPALDFIYKVMKPISEIMPENPINSVVPILQLAGMRAVTGGQKYETENVVKIVPKRVVVEGRIKHVCSACNYSRVSWGAVNTHIVKDHVGQSYVCPTCGKVLTSMDGLRRHKEKQHTA